MKIARYSYLNEVHYGEVKGSLVHEMTGDPFDSFEVAKPGIPLSDVRLLSPVEPRKLICVGLNYALHAKESGLKIPTDPMIFMCSPAAIVAHEENIILNSNEDPVEFEAELVIVVKDRCKNVSREEAYSHILGYTCGNDVSNRRLQRADGQFTRAKSFDTYKPLGPWIETELDVTHLKISLKQNGHVKQDSVTSDMIFSVEEVFEFVSSVMTLEPGDIIMTGTPSGVAPMRAGDTIEIEIEGIGKLRNRVKVTNKE